MNHNNTWKKRIAAITKASHKFIFPSLLMREDFISYAVGKFFSGRKTALKNLYTDFLRERLGDNRYKSHLVKKNILAFNSLYTENLALKSNYQTSHIDFFRLLPPTLTRIERSLIILTHKWGFEVSELGECFCLTEGRISQLRKSAYKKIRDYMEGEGKR